MDPGIGPPKSGCRANIISPVETAFGRKNHDRTNTIADAIQIHQENLNAAGRAKLMGSNLGSETISKVRFPCLSGICLTAARGAAGDRSVTSDSRSPHSILVLALAPNPRSAPNELLGGAHSRILNCLYSSRASIQATISARSCFESRSP